MKYSLKKIDPTFKKGIEAEIRLVNIIRSLREEISWVGKARLAGTRQDQIGIDILAFIEPEEGGANIKVPIQVKSSYAGFLKYQERYPENIEAGVLVIVVHPYHSDDFLKVILKKKLERIRETGQSFHDFFAAKKELIKNCFPVKMNTESQKSAFIRRQTKRSF